jgi:2-amino-4-hydroxy-6-hydroxymethyldihydropteridine diphosphokinase
MTQVFIGLGANIGDREGSLAEAVRRLEAEVGPVVLRSSTYRTDPVEVVDQAEFLNQVVAIETAFPPAALLARLLAIERGMGRVRARDKGPRTIDLDLLLHGGAIVREPGLEVPHPRLHLRRFVLVPLAEIAPNLAHPVLGEAMRALLERCPDRARVCLA